ncbi:cation-translocating P-type ATPase, partial [Ectothiorhodospiraceae bacterium WFHF3C12]|nr:cation-translocating P-type ATPase [Ectothiorhodospiraceae bacterium WFHF3C12]
MSATASTPHQDTALQIEGMMCAGCAAAVAATLQRQPGVINAGVNFAADAATVRWDPGLTSLEALQAAVRRLGYTIRPAGEGGGAGDRPQAAFRRALQMRLAVAVCFGMWSMMSAILTYLAPLGVVELWAEWHLALASGVLALPVLLYSGYGFYVAGWRTLRARVPGMDTLITIAVLAAATVSVVQLARGSTGVYFDAAVMLITFQLVARLIDLGVRRNATRAVHAYLGALPERARLVDGSGVWDVAVADLTAGDVIHVTPGDAIPVDGMVVDGRSTLDQALITGESTPQTCTGGDEVLAGTRNGDGTLRVRVTAGAGARRIDALARSVRQLLSRKSALQRLTDRSARALLPIVLMAAAVATVLALGNDASGTDAATRALAVLIVTCPCALSLAVPLVAVLTVGAAGRSGIIFRDPAVLEFAARARVVVFDKTGTLTRAQPWVHEVEPADGVGEDQVLEAAAIALTGTRHPLASGLAARTGVTKAEGERDITPGEGTHWRAPPSTIHAGRASWLRRAGIPVPTAADHGTELCVARDGRFIGRIHFSEALRPEASATVAALQQLGCEIHLVSGDSAAACQRVADQLGIDACNVAHTCSPEQKLAIIRELQARRPTAFVGDGQNDGPALAAAELGIAVGEADPTARAAAAAL